MNKKTLLIWCGDSWSFGSELSNPKLYRFPTLISNQLNVDTINLSKPGSSINYLTYKLKQILKLQQKFKTTHNIVVLFGLTVPGRLCIENDFGSKVIVSPNKFDICAFKEWGKDIFSNKHIQTQNAITLMFLADQCRKNHIKFKFFNILSNINDYNDTWVSKLLDHSDWLISPQWSTYCSLFDLNNLDFRKVHALESTKFGKTIITEFIKPNISHPNIDGHKKITNYMIPYITNFINS